eukprot:15449458-Alexandrium_andersonii.AAC.1
MTWPPSDRIRTSNVAPFGAKPSHATRDVLASNTKAGHRGWLLRRRGRSRSEAQQGLGRPKACRCEWPRVQTTGVQTAANRCKLLQASATPVIRVSENAERWPSCCVKGIFAHSAAPVALFCWGGLRGSSLLESPCMPLWLHMAVGLTGASGARGLAGGAAAPPDPPSGALACT